MFLSRYLRGRGLHRTFFQHHKHGRTASTLVVALSGGVDSSVVAALLKKQVDESQKNDATRIINLQAVHMTNWNQQDEEGEDNLPLEKVCYEQDWKDAARVAEHLQLPIQRQRLESEYWTHVFEPYLEDMVENGTMGNPDINCNVHVKFGALREKLRQKFGPDGTWLATGHYARLWYHNFPSNDDQNDPVGSLLVKDYTPLVQQHLSIPNNDWLWKLHLNKKKSNSKSPWLLAAVDLTKDQSYFLAGCSSSQLARVWFPLGDFYKKIKAPSSVASQKEPLTVRDLAAQLDLPTAHKAESMGICFVGKRKSWKTFVQEFISKDLQPKPVDFVDIETGEILGQSEGPSHPSFYTRGRGAKLGGLHQKYFVVGSQQRSPKNPDSNNAAIARSMDHAVWVGAGTHHPALYSDSLTVRDMNWIVLDDPTSIPEPLQESGGVLTVQCRIRHLQALNDCQVTFDSTAGVYTIHLSRPFRAIMPGQMLVLYAGLICLGGGPILDRGDSYWEMGKELPPALLPVDRKSS